MFIGYAGHVPGNDASNATIATIQATDQTSQQTQPTQAVATPTPAPFAVGKQANVGYWNVLVNSAKTHGGDDVSPLQSGDIFRVIDVTVTNISGSSQLMASGYYFRITDSTGQTYDEQVTDFGGPPEGTIIANGKLRGQLIYVVPTSMHTFTLQVLGDNSTDASYALWTIMT